MISCWFTVCFFLATVCEYLLASLIIDHQSAPSFFQRVSSFCSHIFSRHTFSFPLSPFTLLFYFTNSTASTKWHSTAIYIFHVYLEQNTCSLSLCAEAQDGLSSFWSGFFSSFILFWAFCVATCLASLPAGHTCSSLGDKYMQHCKHRHKHTHPHMLNSPPERKNISWKFSTIILSDPVWATEVVNPICDLSNLTISPNGFTQIYDNVCDVQISNCPFRK